MTWGTVGGYVSATKSARYYIQGEEQGRDSRGFIIIAPVTAPSVDAAFKRWNEAGQPSELSLTAQARVSA